MAITITCRGFSINNNIENHIKDSIDKYIMKFFDHDISVKVTVSKEAHQFHTVISLDDHHGEFVKVSFITNNAYRSVDGAIISLSGKLSRYKKERINEYRHNKNSLKKQIHAKRYLLDDNDLRDDENRDNPSMIGEVKLAVKSMSVSEAIMEMDLLSVPALLFINSETDKISMVYLEGNGNVALVEPSLDSLNL